MSDACNRSERRRERKAMSAAGIAAMHRITIDRGAIVAASEKGVDAIDVVMLHVDAALRVLIDQGGDVLGHSVITIGTHPDHPDDVTIEAKVARLVKPEGGV